MWFVTWTTESEQKRERRFPRETAARKYYMLLARRNRAKTQAIFERKRGQAPEVPGQSL